MNICIEISHWYLIVAEIMFSVTLLLIHEVYNEENKAMDATAIIINCLYLETETDSQMYAC